MKQDADCDIMAFTFDYTDSPACLLNFKMPARTFRRTMEVIISLVKFQFTLLYLDLIIIFFRTAGKCTGYVRNVLSLLHRAGVSLNLKKWKSFKNRIDYLEYMIRPRGLEVVSYTTAAICYLKIPRTVTELKSSLGPCNE